MSIRGNHSVASPTSNGPGEEDDSYIVIPEFLFDSTEEKNAPLQEIAELTRSFDERIRSIAEAFIHNLSSIYQLARLPLDLVFQGSFSAWGLANVFLDLGRNHPQMRLKKTKFIEMATKARARAEENVDGAASLVRMDLELLSSDPSFVSTSQELMTQGLVLAWSSLEVLAGDVFCAALNAQPRVAMPLLADTSVKKYLALDKVSVDLLAEFDFDLSSSMGTILTRDLNLSSIVKIKAIALSLFEGSDDLRTVLNSRVLYELSERRHLIVHRRGVVDAKYVRSVGDRRSEGERLQITKQELDEAVQQVSLCGLRLLVASQNLVADCR